MSAPTGHSWSLLEGTDHDPPPASALGLHWGKCLRGAKGPYPIHRYQLPLQETAFSNTPRTTWEPNEATAQAWKITICNDSTQDWALCTWPPCSPTPEPAAFPL